MHEIVVQSVPYMATENRVIKTVLDYYKVKEPYVLMSAKYAHTGRLVLIYMLYTYSPLGQKEVSKLLKMGSRQISYIIQEARHSENTSVIKAINQIIKEL